MAMGAFLSGVMLAESSYRHELEADIEPFRGVLLAIFFMAVGLSLQLDVLIDNAIFIIVAVPIFMAVKAVIIYGLCRVTGSSHDDAVRIAFLLPQGGEFGFVLFTTAGAAGLMSASTASLLIAIVTLSMALTPLGAALSKRMLEGDEQEELDEDFEGAGADVLMVGFSRFGQIAAQILLAGGRDVTVIDFSADRIRQASSFGFRIYFGDGTRKDVLRSAGIDRAKIVRRLHAEAGDHRQGGGAGAGRLSAREALRALLRPHPFDRAAETSASTTSCAKRWNPVFCSAVARWRRLVSATDDAYEIGEDIRRRDEERLVLQVTEGLQAGRDMLLLPSGPAGTAGKAKAGDGFRRGSAGWNGRSDGGRLEPFRRASNS